MKRAVGVLGKNATFKSNCSSVTFREPSYARCIIDWLLLKSVDYCTLRKSVLLLCLQVLIKCVSAILVKPGDQVRMEVDIVKMLKVNGQG